MKALFHENRPVGIEAVDIYSSDTEFKKELTIILVPNLILVKKCGFLLNSKILPFILNHL